MLFGRLKTSEGIHVFLYAGLCFLERINIEKREMQCGNTPASSIDGKQRRDLSLSSFPDLQLSAHKYSWRATYQKVPSPQDLTPHWQSWVGPVGAQETPAGGGGAVRDAWLLCPPVTLQAPANEFHHQGHSFSPGGFLLLYWNGIVCSEDMANCLLAVQGSQRSPNRGKSSLLINWL